METSACQSLYERERVCVCVHIFTHGDFFFFPSVFNIECHESERQCVLHCVQVLFVFCKSSQFCNKFSNIEAVFTVFGIPV